MEDVQNLPDDRRVPIDRVGVSNLSYPIVVLDRANQRQPTVASLTMSGPTRPGNRCMMQHTT
jgi:GTP cyclohydrolase I